jgi:response regulator of citrate/malate metabolism
MISVLVVDDDFMVASIHRQYVERVAGFSVVGEAHSGRDALSLTRSLRPELVLLDVYLPDMSGLDVLRELRASMQVDVLAVTAARDAETLRAALQLGVVHYLVKPFTFPALRDKLETYGSWAQALRRTAISGQAEVDRLLGVLRTETAVRVLPKGLCAETMELIAGVVADAEDEVTAVDVAAAVGVSRVTARRYLDHLHHAGAVKLRLKYGSSGRPLHLYSHGADEAVRKRQGG